MLGRANANHSCYCRYDCQCVTRSGIRRLRARLPNIKVAHCTTVLCPTDCAVQYVKVGRVGAQHS